MNDSEDYSFLPMFISEEIFVLPQEKDTQSKTNTTPESASQVKPILVLSQHAIDKAQAELLSKILSAVNIDQTQYEILPLSTYRLELLTQRSHVFLFSDGLALPHDFLIAEKYQPVPITGGSQLIYADPLSLLASNADLKRQLWAAMKKVFN
jgi:DNA polymerase III psi subunit